MSNSEEKVHRYNGVGLGVDPMQRLASFKPPRDFTLGAAKAKKVFTPNLNVSRNKKKGQTVPGSRESKKEDKGKKERKNDRNRNNKNGPQIIRSSGIFSEGMGKGTQPASHRTQAQHSNNPATLQRPIIRIKDVVKIDKELEKQKIHAVTRQGQFVEKDVEDFKPSSDIDAPIKLPMDKNGWSLNKNKAKSVTMNPEVQLKKEPLDEDRLVAEEKKAVPEVKKEIIEDTDLVDLLSSDQPTLMLFKFPDILPGCASNGEEEPRRRPQQQSSRSTTSAGTAQNTAQEENKCNLKSLDEGRIGKLQVHRSGRVTLLLGETNFEVSLSAKAAYHQEAVSVSVDHNSRSATMVDLGTICHKLTAFPDWEGILSEAPPS